MRRLIALLLLAFLPFQFSWATVAGYCAHSANTGSWHLGHDGHHHRHHHQHHAHAGTNAAVAGPAGVHVIAHAAHSAPDAQAEAAAPTEPTALAADGSELTPGNPAPELGCGHCHGTCSALITVSPGLPGHTASAPPGMAPQAADVARALARPERPQWAGLA